MDPNYSTKPSALTSHSSDRLQRPRAKVVEDLEAGEAAEPEAGVAKEVEARRRRTREIDPTQHLGDRIVPAFCLGVLWIRAGS